MKKYLLGALFILSAAAFAGVENGAKVDLNGSAKLAIPVQVDGRVVEPVEQSLIIEVDGVAASGINIKMDDIVAGKTAEKAYSKSTFKAKIVTADGIVKPFTNKPEVKFIYDGRETTEPVVNEIVSGSATDVKLAYNLFVDDSNKNEYLGAITVEATPGKLPGTYTDTTVQLKVEVSGQEL